MTIVTAIVITMDHNAHLITGLLTPQITTFQTSLIGVGATIQVVVVVLMIAIIEMAGVMDAMDVMDVMDVTDVTIVVIHLHIVAGINQIGPAIHQVGEITQITLAAKLAVKLNYNNVIPQYFSISFII